jgi:RNA polymerase sigma-70 factor (ECF subfamily)
VRNPQAGDADERRQRFESVYAANFGVVLGYALRRTRNGDDAADVVAETFLAAWRRLEEVPPGDRARLWLYGVARRVLANYYRGQRRRSGLSDRLRAELAGAPPGREPVPGLAGIGAAFASLPDADRELLALVAWEGLDSAQIGAVLGCSPNAARIRLHRARNKFRKVLNSRGEFAHPVLAGISNGESA